METKQTKGIGSKIRRNAAGFFQGPYFDYYLILILVGLLTLIGIAMVTSSSMPTSVAEGAGPLETAIRQSIMVALGLVAMLIALRVRPNKVRKYSIGVLILAIVFLIAVLVPGIGTGREEVGSQSWIIIGPLTFQPSEFARVAIAIFGAHYLGKEEPRTQNRRFIIYACISGFMAALIFLEGDFGMTIAFLVVAGAMFFFAGLPLRYLAWPIAFFGLLLVLVLPSKGGFRGDRLHTFVEALRGNFTDTRGTAYQSYQGFLSLADGGIKGVGIGQSRAKWFYLPEAKNDFIFAIVGEELGFIGAAIVILLFCGLGMVGFRTASRAGNLYLALLAGTLTSSIVIQAFINIAYVVGLVPVTGIQLPLISAGGTSAVITLAAMGLLANCARHEPEAISAMQNKGRPKIDLLLRLPEPSVDNMDVNESAKPREKLENRQDRRGAQRRPGDGRSGDTGVRQQAKNSQTRSNPTMRRRPPSRHWR